MRWRVVTPFWNLSNMVQEIAVDDDDKLRPLLLSTVSIDLVLDPATPETIALIEKAARRHSVGLTRLELPSRPRTENDPPETTGRPPSGR